MLSYSNKTNCLSKTEIFLPTFAHPILLILTESP